MSHTPVGGAHLHWGIMLMVLVMGCSTMSLDEVRGDLPIARKTRLMLAAGSGSRSGVDQALALGDDVNAKSDELWTALHFAAATGSAEIVALLLDRGARVNAMDDYLITPLHAAVLGGDSSVVTILANRGANLTARDAQGATPMHLAAQLRRDDIVDLLAARGTAVVPVSDGPLDLWATAAGHRAVARMQAGQGNMTAADAAYAAAADAFGQAGAGFQQNAERLRDRAFRTRVNAVALGILLGLSGAANELHAMQTARTAALQNAQYDALAKAARGQPGPGRGTGFAIYSVPDVAGPTRWTFARANSFDAAATGMEHAATESAAAAGECRSLIGRGTGATP